MVTLLLMSNNVCITGVIGTDFINRCQSKCCLSCQHVIKSSTISEVKTNLSNPVAETFVVM